MAAEWLKTPEFETVVIELSWFQILRRTSVFTQTTNDLKSTFFYQKKITLFELLSRTSVLPKPQIKIIFFIRQNPFVCIASE